jgi:hypothetical protein
MTSRIFVLLQTSLCLRVEIRDGEADPVLAFESNPMPDQREGVSDVRNVERDDPVFGVPGPAALAARAVGW